MFVSLSFARVTIVGIASLLIASWVPVAQAAHAASTFVLNDGSNANLTFSLNIPYNSPNNDLYFHLSGSAGYSWIAVGCGSQMKNALIFAVYASTQKDNVTVSPRLASGHREPEYTSAVTIEYLDGTGITNDTYVANVRCRGCRKWASGSVDLTSSSQPWIYALGPNENLRSASQSAMMRRHSAYGHFSLNMVQAQGDAGLPTGANLTTTNGATMDGKPNADHEVGVPLHALFMAGTFVILFPLGVLSVSILGRVRWHQVFQMVGMLAITAGLGIGIYESKIQNRTRSVRQPHQVLGILIWISALAQTTAGWLQHRHFQASGQKSPIHTYHRIFGVVVIGLGLINGGLGFQLGSDSPNTDHAGLYSVIIVALLIVVGGAFLWRNRHRRRQRALTSPAARNYQQGLAEERAAQEGGVPLGEMGAQGHQAPPPAYSRPI